MRNKKCIQGNERILLILLLVMLNLSCSKEWFNEKKDKSLTVPNTLADFEAILNHPDLTKKGPEQLNIGADAFYVSENGWQNGSITDIDRNSFSWTKNWPYVNDPGWSSIFSNVFYCNVVLDGLTKIVPINSTEQVQYNRIKGSALFLRSKSFYELSQVWSPMLTEKSKNDPFGVPLRLQSEINSKSIRSTIAKTFEQIIGDLKIALNLLPNITAFKSLPSKSASYGLLARCYLSIENYQNAKLYSDSCLSLQNVLLDYDSIFNNSYNEYGPFGQFNAEVIFESQMGGTYLMTNLALVEPSLYELYEDNDTRKELFFNKNLDNTIKFVGQYSEGYYRFFNGIATDEIYLIRAESKVRLGDIDGGMADLNHLLRNRWKDGMFIDKNASNELEALTIIIEERQKELIGRGLRWSDLRRLNLDNRFQKTIKHFMAGVVYELEPNSFRYTFPIPSNEISLSKISQNPGWLK